ncbi:MAG: transglutaminase domain-containing protein [Hamadaea sp.]|nr:transglutaminase domain-containing protein [Hamadaea sp.]NUT04688.1 transglutaminase domain-containing protein [Hamadaea sp.]
MVRLVRALGVPVLLAGMIVLAGWTLGGIYDGPLLFQLVAGAGVASVLLAVAVRRLPSYADAPLSVLGLLAYLALAVWLSARQADIPGSLPEVAADAVANGIPRLLTALVPVEPQPDTVVIPVIAAWLAGLTAAELAGRAQRTLLSLLPPTLLYGGALFLVGPHRGGLGTGLIFAGLAIAALALTGTSAARAAAPDPVRTDRIDAVTRRALQVRAAVAALAGVTVIVAVAALLGPGLAGVVDKPPVDPRAYVTPPQLDALDQNPLIRLSGWAVNPTEHLLDTNLSADSAIRLAVLPDYDGVTWHVSGEYRPAARTLPSPPAPPAAAPGAEQAIAKDATVTQDITVVGLGGKLLPAVASARRVDGLRVSVDVDSGTLMLPTGLTPGMSYAVTSVQTVPDENTLPMADVPTGPEVSRYLAVGSGTLPERMRQLVERLAADNSAAYARASAIEQFLATHYRLDGGAPSGHALPNLDYFLFGDKTGYGGGKGTAEQFAAAYAVLARMMGLPARVVVGFHAKKGASQVLASDAYAWPEVLFAGVGWVAFDPLPRPGQQPEPLEEQFKPKPEPSTEPPSQEPLPTESVSASAAVPSGSGGSAAAAGSVLPMVGAGAGGLFVLVLAGLLVALLVARRGLRRRRLDEGTPADRVAGAWLEVSDALRLAGQGSPQHLTAAEVAAFAGEAAAPPGRKHVRLPAPRLDDLAWLVNAAEFSAGRLAEDDAHRARASATAYVGELRARRSWWRRLIWSIHPGPLRWHRRG